jgi:hypothetical protein
MTIKIERIIGKEYATVVYDEHTVQLVPNQVFPNTVLDTLKVPEGTIVAYSLDEETLHAATSKGTVQITPEEFYSIGESSENQKAPVVQVVPSVPKTEEVSKPAEATGTNTK